MSLLSTSSTWERICIFSIPFLFSVAIAALFYPGFMSYDTLHALEGARNGVTESMWPPMVSYVWRVVDLVSDNPSAMHFSQVFLLLLSVFHIVFMFTKKISYALMFMLLYLSLPTVLGTLAVIWKDVLMTALFMAGFAVIICIKKTKNPSVVDNSSCQAPRLVFLSLLALIFLFIGVCSRHNAITGALPLIFFLAWVLCSRRCKTKRHVFFSALFLGATLTGAIYFTKVQLDHYSLPGFVKMNSSTDDFLQSVRVLDIAGASLCAKHNLFESIAPDMSLLDLERLYEPKHINLSAGLFSKIGYNLTNKELKINKLWLNIALHHPLCFFYNKYLLTKYLIGAHAGPPFLITAPAVDSNIYGYQLAESALRNSVVTYIIKASKHFFSKPWFIYLLSIGAFLYLMQRKPFRLEYSLLALSGILYFSSLVMFGNAADARLPFYTTTVLFMLVFIALSQRLFVLCK